MYARTFSSSNPTVETAQPRAQKCSARKVPFFAAQARGGDGTLPFQKPERRRDRALGRNGVANARLIRHQVALDDLALLLPGQRVEDRTQAPNRLPNGIGPDKGLTLHPLHADFIKPLGEDFTFGTVKPLRVSLVAPSGLPLESGTGPRRRTGCPLPQEDGGGDSAQQRRQRGKRRCRRATPRPGSESGRRHRRLEVAGWQTS